MQKRKGGKLTSGTMKLMAISGTCRMIRWRRSTGEGSIYTTNQAGANLTYLFAASVESKGVQVDMVTVRMVIKGLRR